MRKSRRVSRKVRRCGCWDKIEVGRGVWALAACHGVVAVWGWVGGWIPISVCKEMTKKVGVCNSVEGKWSKRFGSYIGDIEF